MNAPKQDKASEPIKPTTKTTQPPRGASRYETYAATQAAADGVEGDVRKKDKTENEKLAAQMTDRR